MVHIRQHSGGKSLFLMVGKEEIEALDGFSKVDAGGSWYKSVNFGAEKDLFGGGE